MKKIFFVMLIAFTAKMKAQITYEQTYDSAATWNICQASNQLMIIKLEVAGERYVKINRCGKHIKLYDLSHSLVKTISLATLPLDGSPGSIGTVLYLSEKLFNNDSKIEFMYVMTSTTYSTMIYDEDANLLFSEPGAPMVMLNVPQQQCPIYNTSAGTKMILTYQSGQAKVFGLGGTLSIGIQNANGALENEQGFAVSNPMPNPSYNQTKINYVLPQGVTEADVVLYDMQSKEIKRFKVDNTFDNLLISTQDISAGTYFYQLQTSGQNSGAKKMIVVKN